MNSTPDKVDDSDDDWIRSQSLRIKKDEEKRLAKLELDFLKEKEEKFKELKRRRKTIQKETTVIANNTFISNIIDGLINCVNISGENPESVYGP